MVDLKFNFKHVCFAKQNNNTNTTAVALLSSMDFLFKLLKDESWLNQFLTSIFFCKQGGSISFISVHSTSSLKWITSADFFFHYFHP